MKARHEHDLERLSRTCGILSSYRSVTGETVPIDSAARIALLAAMGIDAGTEESTAAAILELEREFWTTAIEPVRVVRVDEQPLRFSGCLPEAFLQTRWAVTVHEESGRLQHGFVEPAPLRHRRIDGVSRVFCEMRLAFTLPEGVHELELHGQIGAPESARMSLIVCPRQAYTTENRRLALTLQTYALRSERPGYHGIGTLSEVKSLARTLPGWFPGLSPVHALFYNEPDRRSPYSPSSRMHLNPFLIDLEAIPEFARSRAARALLAEPAFQRELDRLRAAPTIPYAAVAAWRGRVLALLFDTFRAAVYGTGSARDFAFSRFIREGGEPLRNFALFEALRERFGTPPPGFESPDHPAARAFATRHEDRLLYFLYLQWNARAQLRSLERSLRRDGGGLYLDLAVGAAPDGAEVWCNPGAYARAFIGAPPDAFAPQGQNWNLAPFHPLELRRQAYRPFRELLRANLPPGGILRIDHVMGLSRLYWTGPTGGGYVRYPFADLSGILALESQRRRCTIIGEDLGTLPDDMRARLQESRLYSFRVLYFEKNGDEFIPPAAYPRDAAAAVNTHDLPTIRGFFHGHDIDLRAKLGHLAPEATADEHARRKIEVAALTRLAGFAPGDQVPDAALIDALHRLLLQTPARILLVSLHDLLEETEQPNLPGTVDEYPSWALRYSRSVADLAAAPRLRAFLDQAAGRS